MWVAGGGGEGAEGIGVREIGAVRGVGGGKAGAEEGGAVAWARAWDGAG